MPPRHRVPTRRWGNAARREVGFDLKTIPRNRLSSLSSMHQSMARPDQHNRSQITRDGFERIAAGLWERHRPA
jgi:hypothetical protein